MCLSHIHVVDVKATAATCNSSRSMTGRITEFMFGDAACAHHDSIAVEVRHALFVAPQLKIRSANSPHTTTTKIFWVLEPANKHFLLLHLAFPCCCQQCYRSYQLQVKHHSSGIPVAATQFRKADSREHTQSTCLSTSAAATQYRAHHGSTGTSSN
jgi:hypothetical protein